MQNNLATGKKWNILVVDDSQFNCELIADILGDQYDYTFAADGEEALALLMHDERADILLLDMNMPNMNGMDFLKLMNGNGWTEEIPVIAISAEGDAAFMQNAYELGAVDYLVRPFDAFLLQYRVRNTLVQYSHKKRLVSLVEEEIAKREDTSNLLVNIFSNIVELRNSESGGHTLHVQMITRMLLEQLARQGGKYALTDEEISMISTASALHDIGKSMIPVEILNKPGKLTAEEWEIMKSHTVKGDAFLSDVHASGKEQLLVYAREICRSHHERWDGGGYPDGLRGEEIPLSAQVVSLADVYDALTTDRCYKKAYTHRQAVEMICKGECGAFDPVLLNCFLQIVEEIHLSLGLGTGELYGTNHSAVLAREMLYHENIPVEERSYSLAELEEEKKEFFVSQCHGIQFEYDAATRRVTFMRYFNADGEQRMLPAESTSLLKAEDLKLLLTRVQALTPQKPTLSMDVLIPINGDMRWHRLTVRGIWGRGEEMYCYLVGSFTDIGERMIRQSTGITVKGKTVSGEGLLTLRRLFEVARLVSPKNCQILKITEEGLIEAGEACFDFWNRQERCENCSAAKALDSRHWTSKLETKDGRIYFVLARRVSYQDEDCVLELALNMDEAIEKSRDVIGHHIFDINMLKSIYRDTVTKVYSRAYLDHFSYGFEHAKGVAVIDVNKFKSINDIYGHIAGDVALGHVAAVVKSCIRKEDLLIRYGGDEFVLVFLEISEERFFRKLAEIKRAVADSTVVEYPDMTTGVSIGGVYDVHPFKKAVELADKEMYKDKFRAED